MRRRQHAARSACRTAGRALPPRTRPVIEERPQWIARGGRGRHRLQKPQHVQQGEAKKEGVASARRASAARMEVTSSAPNVSRRRFRIFAAIIVKEISSATCSSTAVHSKTAPCGETRVGHPDYAPEVVYRYCSTTLSSAPKQLLGVPMLAECLQGSRFEPSTELNSHRLK